MRRIRKVLLDGATAAVTLGAVGLAAVRIDEYVAVRRAAAVDAPREIADWRDYGVSGHRLGPATAAVTIVEFADFQCPFCARAAEDLRAIRRERPEDVSLVFRHYPIAGHPHARTAALARECAAEQQRFEAMHDLLYAEPESIGIRTWTKLADLAGVADTAAFDDCLANAAHEPDLARDVAAGSALKVDGTPTFVINRLRVAGYPGKEKLEEYVSDALREAKR